MNDSVYMVHLIIATLLRQLGPEDMTRNTQKISRVYRIWVNGQVSKDKERYMRLASKADVAWNEMNKELSDRSVTSQISLPVTFLAMGDLITRKKDKLIPQKLLETFVESHTDHTCRTKETESAAVIVTDIIRHKLGFPERKFASLSGKIALAKKIKEQNDILEGKI